MSEYKIAALSDGREIKVDVEFVRREVKTRKDIKAIINTPVGSDDYDRMIAKYSGIAFEDVVNLSVDDFRAVDRAIGEALKELSSPNSR